ncbi:hypothetical protein CFOL_v3_20828 [Cephalotus follicularis]|uniref:RVT_2 domain-containing protein n=1 Tax=Cephalotus follicularis TaxID=3775 RepID=A0A1Q3CAU6_CEPFO|nr:hypothetical protein CFOL_v3_20828 [Cephalotus follicularis]
MELNVKYSGDSGNSIADPLLYRRLVGSLIYLCITRPNISFAVHTVSQFMQDLKHFHMAAVFRIIRYLRGHSTTGLFFPASNNTCLRAYADADWASCPDTRRSTTGWCMFLGNSLISWKCKKQDRVSKSSTEAEYRSMSAACSEIVWLSDLLDELGFPQNTTTSLSADNMSAIKIATNPVFHERTKHIEVDSHAIRNELLQSTISLPHVSSTLQLADIFTKPLTAARHQFLVSKLMLFANDTSI